ncbi:CBS domain-containing protein [Lutibaculum baratangense]|uniref:Inosine-5'-monophosphate dehydrogenase n=1 Tax=Lutibaculum baratangense AMV1 TaxID=631454 RepID=V4R690_9HYPH|nr:CBS domain-containing protein [Lutibaculum baratangense]ESR27447.1 Inosine-5'-monophosphate dehydrogenase [Lutibaculum baratangense AMV1]
MQVKDVMQRPVVTVSPATTVREIAELLLEKRISAVPVVDEAGQVQGIVSEGDLMRRPETGTERHPSWWLDLFTTRAERPADFIKSHGMLAREVMTRNVVTVDEEASLEEVAAELERHRIKRVPVLRDAKLVGIVSRADLLRGIVSRKAGESPTVDDRELKRAVDRALGEAGVDTAFVSAVVTNGVVHLWGGVNTRQEKEAAGVAARSVPGVKDVQDEIGVFPPIVRSTMWAE